ncbi:type II toxin-antitoxin system RelE/ParE family toxin [Burkholderia ubonensis]|uniref:type II toxin-antitoxin system RelE/ParE family toxin n=1 Tax=Burkholderia ubonensis TaxID=101571 RepID=UPI00075F3F5E|nr:addiction module protein [Burkholderia ubonensis]KVP55959.1 addiction module protein [Burkholderia ubonensis]KVR45681.1 addiction module protein [Burkholderia ubonensis]KVV11993.1 addiction module protein [Burkholderia ubonensis]KVW27675.1 addiction module protein [Burkholderia ubonensis]KVZ39338.1 addiction module protein [Burkholderia ubonensis]
MPYIPPVFTIRTTEFFDAWFDALQDRIAKRRIQARIDHGPGYRVYYVQRGSAWVILLCGGDKSTQQAHIRAAHAMLEHLDLDTE